MKPNPAPPRRTVLIILLVVVPVLFLMAWSQASLDLSFIRPENAQQTIILLALSAFVFVAFVIFGFILLRILLKLYAERRQRQLGSRFKTRMVVAALVLTLVPVSMLFIFAYGLLNRSIDKWFSIPFDVVRTDATDMVQSLETQAEDRAVHIANHLAANPILQHALGRRDRKAVQLELEREVADARLEAALCFDSQGHLAARAGEPFPSLSEVSALFPGLEYGHPRESAGPVEWRSADYEFFLTARPVGSVESGAAGTIVSATRLSLRTRKIADDIQREAQKYAELSHERRAVKRAYISILWLLTLLILFASTWLAMYISKQVTVPIQALAEATHEVSKGNLGYQISVRATDELGTTIRSFNEMTQQLQENRLAIERAAQELQRANRELEERGNTMEAILENIPTGVISLDTEGRITRINTTAQRMFVGVDVKRAHELRDLFSAEDTLEISRLFRRAARQGFAASHMELELGSRRAVVALTASSVRAGYGTVGWVLVLEDLSELLRAQKTAAWREVAQRIAHEIKNPLTPIQLSAERIHRLLERSGSPPPASQLASAIEESATLIRREVESLKALVDEFSDFARFPSSEPKPSSLNLVVENALKVFDGRLDGIAVHQELAHDLPLVEVDPEQIKRAVVNLIDNAAEALERSPHKEIWVRTALDPEREIVEITVADSGPGIPPEAKEKLFLPYFSTKQRGTGLGLAIVSRIVTEHNGSIRVEENPPSGSRFVIELPVEQNAVTDRG